MPLELIQELIHEALLKKGKHPRYLVVSGIFSVQLRSSLASMKAYSIRPIEVDSYTELSEVMGLKVVDLKMDNFDLMEVGF